MLSHDSMFRPGNLALKSVPLVIVGQSLPHIVIAINIINSYARLNSRFNRSVVCFYAAIVLQSGNATTAVALLISERDIVYGLLDGTTPFQGRHSRALLGFIIFMEGKSRYDHEEHS